MATDELDLAPATPAAGSPPGPRGLGTPAAPGTGSGAGSATGSAGFSTDAELAAGPVAASRPAAPAGTSTDKVKVLYIGGTGRSGSTLLDNILGQIPGFCSVGELRYVWERGMVDNRLCGCGRPFRECPLWASVLTEAFGDAERLDPAEMIRLQQARVRSRHVPRLLASRPDRSPPPPGSYEARLERLYHALAGQTGARVIVDSSKLPSYGRVLQDIPSLDLYVVQLMRDPRATAYSWMRKRELRDYGDLRWMQRQPPLKSSGLWGMWNAVAELFWRPLGDHYLQLRYEDFVADPQPTVRRVLRLVGEEGAELPFTGPHTVRLGPTHSVAGNPSRLANGEVELQVDAEWMRRMDRKDRTLVTAVTWPLLLRYGYVGRRPGTSDRRSGPSEGGRR